MSLHYLSTRGGVPPATFEDVLLEGLAADGGLYLPERWPQLGPDDLARLRGAPYAELATHVMWPFVEDSLDRATFEALIARAYASFDHVAVAPLVQIGPGDWIMELFHGPTLAFKDCALQLLGLLFEDALRRRQKRITIVGATSGDTGAAAIHACAGREGIEIVILHPKGRVSEVQRRQMTTVEAANVHNVAVEGTFDDCQALLKALFADAQFRTRVGLAAINSINWARIMAQIVYFVHASLSLGGAKDPVAFTVPTGNFGDVYAGYAAHRMGLPLARLVVATNRNDILARFFASGRYESEAVHPTISPSMDIQVASNFERLLFDIAGGDGDRVAAMLDGFRSSGALEVVPADLAALRDLFDAHRVDEDRTRATMAEVLKATGEVVDPHTAVGVAASRACRGDPAIPMVTLATAHPAKFPDAVEAATGLRPGLPARMADLHARAERCAVLPDDIDRLKTHILDEVLAST